MAKRTFHVWGLHAVTTMLRLNPQDVLEIWLRESSYVAALNELADAASSVGVAIKYVSPKALDKLSNGSNHQGVVANRRSPVFLDLDEATNAAITDYETKHKANELDASAYRGGPIFLALDQVKDPQNFGACLRLADAAGVSAVLVSGAGQAPLNGVVSKVASGAMDSVKILQIGNLAQGLLKLKKAGFWIIGTDDQAVDCYTEVDMTGPICLVLGSEGEGMRNLTTELCDFLVSIPTSGVVGSLNVSNAAAVCLFEAQRQRRLGKAQELSPEK